MKTIKFENEEYKDKVYISTSFNTTFLQRLLFLFFPKTRIDVELYVKEKMPDYKASQFYIQQYSYIHQLKSWHYRVFNKNRGMVSTD